MKQSVAVACADLAIVQKIDHALAGEFDVRICRSMEDLHTVGSTLTDTDSIIILNSSICPDDPTMRDAIQFIQSQNPMAYMVLISPDDSPTEWVELVKAGVADIITSPLSEPEILLAVRQAFDHANLVDHLRRRMAIETQKSVLDRIELFRNYLQSRACVHQPLSPSEIRIFFPVPSTDAISTATLASVLGASDLNTLTDKLGRKPIALVIEDEPEVSKLIRRSLAKEFNTIAAHSAEDAIQLMESNPDLDLALVDIGLPGISGDEFVPSLKAFNPAMPIIVVTAYPEHRLILKTLHSGASDYLLKPFQPGILLQKAMKQVQNHLAVRFLETYLRSE
ncbi:response regulator [bacterium]|nr:response regulator [bacterium]